MGVTTTKTNKPFNPRAQDQSPLAYNRAALYSGKALDFDGVNDEVLSTITISGAKTFCAWINADGTNNERIISIFTGGYSNLTFSNNKFSMYDGTNVPETTTTFETDQWYFVVAVQEANNAKIYVNGISQPLSTTNWIGHTYSSATIAIGRDASSGSYYDGEISGVKAFNTALTAAQIADLYNFPEKIVPTGLESNLKLWLPMMEGAGTTAYDGSGNGNHGTISGATYVNGVGAPVAQTSVIDWNKGVNTFTYSEDFSNSDWETISVTKVSTSETDYIGGTTAANITWLAGTPRYFFQAKATNVASTLSFYVKSNGGGNKFRLFGNGTIAMGSDMTATSEWVRYDFEFTGNASQGIGIAHATDNSAADLLVCFAQLETNASVGPYTPTIGTAQSNPVLLPAGLTTGRDITGVNLFENVRKQGALNLDGSSYSEVHDNASLDMTDAITLEAWVYLDSAPINNVDSMHSLMTKKSASVTDSEAAFDIRATGANGSIAITGGFDTGVLQTINIATGLSIDQWYHILITYDSGSIVTYLNGAQVNTGSMVSPIIANAYDVWIGRHVNAGGLNSYAEADIAQPRIYNRALTASEVLRNYNSGKNTYTNS